jgi:phage/conjugal plasmid C-4 type zinc finger TraR family protein
MTDVFDRAAEYEEHDRDEAIAAQARRAGLAGKTVADSAAECRLCEDPIPEGRRLAYPGVQTCVECQTELDHALARGTA